MKFEISELNINKIVPYENNPRDNAKTVQRVIDSIRNYGWKVPIVVDENNIILAGHTRLSAAKLLNIKEVPVHVATGLTEEQKTAYRIMDNKSQDFSEWDNKLLSLEFEKLAMTEFDLNMTGFDFSEIEKITANMFDFEEPDEFIIEDNIDELENIQTSNVRMVSLFLDQNNEPAFQDMIMKLRTKWQIDNLTDAVYKAVELCVQDENL
jgi:ParB-like chromosome segregation protein Spo0J